MKATFTFYAGHFFIPKLFILLSDNKTLLEQRNTHHKILTWQRNTSSESNIYFLRRETFLNLLMNCLFFCGIRIVQRLMVRVKILNEKMNLETIMEMFLTTRKYSCMPGA